jgi:ATP-binding cassette subfamily B protein
MTGHLEECGMVWERTPGPAAQPRRSGQISDSKETILTEGLQRRGVRHSLELPYAMFEDQRSGETLGKLQKVRADVEKLIAISVNTLFTTLVGVIFVMIYAFTVHWLIAPVFFLTVPLLGLLSSVLLKRIKKIQKQIVAETTSLAGSTTESLRNIKLVKSLGLARQEIGRLNSITGKILGLELRKVRSLRLLSFIQGTLVNALRTSILFLMLYLIFAQQITERGASRSRGASGSGCRSRGRCCAGRACWCSTRRPRRSIRSRKRRSRARSARWRRARTGSRS